jgi:hypothetical protein
VSARSRAINEHFQRFVLRRSRIHGARQIIIGRARTARDAAVEADQRGDTYFAAALRGKASAYDECAQLLTQLEHDRRLPPRSRYGA